MQTTPKTLCVARVTATVNGSESLVTGNGRHSDSLSAFVKGSRLDGGQILPAGTGRFQESEGTETCPRAERSLDHQVLPVHRAPGIEKKEVIPNQKALIKLTLHHKIESACLFGQYPEYNVSFGVLL